MKRHCATGGPATNYQHSCGVWPVPWDTTNDSSVLNYACSGYDPHYSERSRKIECNSPNSSLYLHRQPAVPDENPTCDNRAAIHTSNHYAGGYHSLNNTVHEPPTLTHGYTPERYFQFGYNDHYALSSYPLHSHYNENYGPTNEAEEFHKRHHSDYPQYYYSQPPAAPQPQPDYLPNADEHRTQQSCINSQEPQGRKARNFPEKLMQALTKFQKDSAVAWLPDGKSFVVVDQDLFVSEVLNNVFRAIKYTSFVRKLHRWGFVRLRSGMGPDCFHHPLFTVNHPYSASYITCTPESRKETLLTVSRNKPSLVGVERFIREVKEAEAAQATAPQGDRLDEGV